MEIEFSRSFKKQYKKAPKEIRFEFERRLKLFIQNQLNPLLKNHHLKGNFSNLRSINITGDWRALYKETISREKKIVIFEVLGTHSQLYR